MTYTSSDSSWLITNTSGVETNFYAYDAFGDLSQGTPGSAFGYAGQYTDATTGLSNMRARWYEPQTGEFTTVDPDLAQTDQPYEYAGDDPVNATDPNGNMALKSDDLNALVNEGVSPSSIGSISSADEFTTEADGRSVFTPIDYLFNYQFGGSCRFWIGTACNKPRQADLQDALIATATIGEYVVWNELWNSPGRFPAGPGDCPGLVDLDGQSESDVPNGFPCFVANEVAPYIFTTFDTITSDASTKWLIDKLAGQGLGIGDETDFVEGMEEIPEIAEPILSFVAASYVTKTGSGGIYCD